MCGFENSNSHFFCLTLFALILLGKRCVTQQRTLFLHRRENFESDSVDMDTHTQITDYNVLVLPPKTRKALKSNLKVSYHSFSLNHRTYKCNVKVFVLKHHKFFFFKKRLMLRPYDFHKWLFCAMRNSTLSQVSCWDNYSVPCPIFQ